MSFIQYPPGAWTPSSAVEHANDILNQINAVLQANNVTDSQGNLIQLAASLGNVVWIMCLAIGQIQAANDTALLAASQMFSIQQESAAQLLETLPMIGTQQIPGAYSLVTIQVTATAAGCTVNAGTKVPFGTICNFIVQTTTVIAPSGTANILCQSDTLGPIAVGAGILTAFAITVPGVASVTNPAGAIIGRNQETIQQLQQRILAGNVINTNLGGTINAIESIQGITEAIVYLNTSPTTNLILQGNIPVPPLSAYIVIAGTDITNVAIANAYSTRMLINTFSVGPGTPAPYVRTDLTFAVYPTNTITTAGGNFVSAGFTVGMWITIGGSASNNFNAQVTKVTASVLTVGQCNLVAESDANSITITVKNVQVYTTASGQLIPILFDYATNQNIYVEVFYDLNTVSSVSFTNSITAIVTAMSWGIGQPVTAALILAALANFQYARITGCRVSLDNTNWFNEVLPNGNQIPTITAGNITVAAG